MENAMSPKILYAAFVACMLVFPAHFASACDQLSPNPNPSGSVAVNASSEGCIDSPYINNGVVRNEGELADNVSNVYTTTFTNNGTIDNSGSLQFNGLVNNGYIDNSGTLIPKVFGSPLWNYGSIDNTGTLYVISS